METILVILLPPSGSEEVETLRSTIGITFSSIWEDNQLLYSLYHLPRDPGHFRIFRQRLAF